MTVTASELTVHRMVGVREEWLSLLRELYVCGGGNILSTHICAFCLSFSGAVAIGKRFYEARRLQ